MRNLIGGGSADAVGASGRRRYKKRRKAGDLEAAKAKAEAEEAAARAAAERDPEGAARGDFEEIRRHPEAVVAWLASFARRIAEELTVKRGPSGVMVDASAPRRAAIQLLFELTASLSHKRRWHHDAGCRALAAQAADAIAAASGEQTERHKRLLAGEYTKKDRGLSLSTRSGRLYVGGVGEDAFVELRKALEERRAAQVLEALELTTGKRSAVADKLQRHARRHAAIERIKAWSLRRQAMGALRYFREHAADGVQTASVQLHASSVLVQPGGTCYFFARADEGAGKPDGTGGEGRRRRRGRRRAVAAVSGAPAALDAIVAAAARPLAVPHGGERAAVGARLRPLLGAVRRRERRPAAAVGRRRPADVAPPPSRRDAPHAAAAGRPRQPRRHERAARRVREPARRLQVPSRHPVPRRDQIAPHLHRVGVQPRADGGAARAALRLLPHAAARLALQGRRVLAHLLPRLVIEPFATSFVRLLVVKLTVAMLSFCLLGACRRRDDEDRLASWRGKKLGAGVAKAKTANLGLHLAALKDIRARPAARRARSPQPHRRHPSQDERRQENATAQPGARRKGVNIQSAWAAAPGAAPALAEESAKPVPVLRLGTARAEMWQATEAAATARVEMDDVSKRAETPRAAAALGVTMPFSKRCSSDGVGGVEASRRMSISTVATDERRSSVADMVAAAKEAALSGVDADAEAAAAASGAAAKAAAAHGAAKSRWGMVRRAAQWGGALAVAAEREAAKRREEEKARVRAALVAAGGGAAGGGGAVGGDPARRDGGGGARPHAAARGRGGARDFSPSEAALERLRAILTWQAGEMEVVSFQLSCKAAQWRVLRRMQPNGEEVAATATAATAASGNPRWPGLPSSRPRCTRRRRRGSTRTSRSPRSPSGRGRRRRRRRRSG